QIIFKKNFLPFHANGLTFFAVLDNNQTYNSTFYSIGGGFVVKEETSTNEEKDQIKASFPFPIDTTDELLVYVSKRINQFQKLFIKTNYPYAHLKKLTEN